MIDGIHLMDPLQMEKMYVYSVRNLQQTWYKPYTLPVIDFQLDEILEDDQPLYRRSRLSTAGDQFYLFFNQKSKQWSVTTEKTESSSCITSQSAACTTVQSPSLPKL